MGNQEIAVESLEKYCLGNVEGLEGLLSKELQICDPPSQFWSRQAYLESLRGNPPEPAGYRILNVAGHED